MEKEIRKSLDELKNIIGNDPDVDSGDQELLLSMLDNFEQVVGFVCDRVDNLGTRT